ncbi:MAG TPA: sugar ABC transporter ATP-binding protein [Capillimicrobium sp.]
MLRAQGLHKRYGPIVAVDGVDLECLAGEVHALVGENGAGKSTVAKILAGAVSPDAGSFTVDGRPVSTGDIRAAHAAGVFCAFQELALVPHWTVAENLALVDRPIAARFSRRRALATAREALERLELGHLDALAVTAELPLADRQQLEIARALAGDVRVLLLDEASSALTPPGVEWLFRRIRELTARGAGVVYVSHRLGELAEIADRGTVLRDGRVVDHFTRGGWTQDELITAMAGRPAERAHPRPAAARDEAVLEVEGLSAPGVRDVSLRLAAGEVLGVGGLQGHGQAELLRALYGALPATARRWEVGGRPVSRLTPVRAVKAGIGFVPEDRKRQGLALSHSVGENLLAPWLRPAGPGGAPLLRRERGWVDRVLGALSVKTAGPQQRVGALSGGNQQKVVFGRWLDRDRRVVLLHDPTRGIDVRAKHELYEAILRLAGDGVGVIWFSTEVEELVHTCHRVVVLYRGAVQDELQGERLTADAVIGAAVGREAVA